MCVPNKKNRHGESNTGRGLNEYLDSNSSELLHQWNWRLPLCTLRTKIPATINNQKCHLYMHGTLFFSPPLSFLLLVVVSYPSTFHFIFIATEVSQKTKRYLQALRKKKRPLSYLHHHHHAANNNSVLYSRFNKNCCLQISRPPPPNYHPLEQLRTGDTYKNSKNNNF